jgi:hypothetical protein
MSKNYTGLMKGVQLYYSLFSMVLIYVVSVTHYQLQSKNIKWKFPKINNSCFNMHAIQNSVMKSHTILLCPARMCIISLSSTSMLYMLPTCSSLNSHLSYQIGCYSFQVTIIYFIMASKYDSSNAKEAPGHKTWKDILALVLCGNAVERTGKDHSVYRGSYCQFQASTEGLGMYTL